jgi:cellulose biosynthesis protein BcsQ
MTQKKQTPKEKITKALHNSVHFILQGKGGVGKSFIASLLCQYFQANDLSLFAFDTDQENQTLAGYSMLHARKISVKDGSHTIDVKGFDKLIESLLVEEGTFLVDTGANTFSPMLAYMTENEVIEFLVENGKKVYIHTVVGGGDVLADTANGFNSIALNSENASVILWMNEHFGKMETAEGKLFTETKVYKDNKEKLAGIVSLPQRNKQTFGDDILRLNTKRLTVAEAMESTDFTIMEKQRIKNVARDVFTQLEQINF